MISAATFTIGCHSFDGDMIPPTPPARNTTYANPNATAFAIAPATHVTTSIAKPCHRGTCATNATAGAAPIPIRATTIAHAIRARQYSRYPTAATAARRPAPACPSRSSVEFPARWTYACGYFDSTSRATALYWPRFSSMIRDAWDGSASIRACSSRVRAPAANRRGPNSSAACACPNVSAAHVE